MIHAYNYLTYLLITNQGVFERFKWVGNLATFLGAVAVGVSLEAATQAWPFTLYLLGSTVWLIAALILRDRALAWLNTFFVLTNTYAIFVRI